MIRDLAVVVRSNLPPAIRPPAKQVPAQGEDEDNEISIAGQRGQAINLDHSQNYSATFTEKQAEQYRIFDKVRVVNPKRPPPGDDPNQAKQYVDLEVTHYIQYKDEFGHLIIEKFAKPKAVRGQIYIMEQNIKRALAPGQR